MTEQGSTLRYNILQQLVGSSQDTFQEILRSANRASDYPKIEEIFMTLTYQLNVSKSEKISYFNPISKRQHHTENAPKPQQFLKNLSQEAD